jgi:5-methylcytosine-specific restriction enzyme subunit McrC
MAIPIENLYWILAYAWKTIPEARQVGVGTERARVPLEPFAQALINGVHHTLRRGMTRGYREEIDEISGVRGRTLLGESIKRGSIPQRRLVCSFDELSYDTKANRIIRGALKVVSANGDLPRSLRRSSRALWDRLIGVADTPLTPRVFRHIQLGSKDRHYSQLLNIARFIMTNTIPTTAGSGRRFRSIDVEGQIATIFERFVREFYRRERPQLKVGARRLKWADTISHDDESERLLPTMLTDVTLEDTNSCLVIDTKFYSQTLRAGRHGGDSKVRELHLYQLISYLENMRRQGAHGTNISGVLLYPYSGTNLDVRWTVHGFPIRAYTLDLGRPWVDVHIDLLKLLE